MSSLENSLDETDCGRKAVGHGAPGVKVSI
jgi:hypothetical protein